MKCTRKVGNKFYLKEQFETQDDAIDVCKVINNRPKQIHKVVPYKCPVCHKYHVGKNKTVINHDKNIYKL